MQGVVQARLLAWETEWVVVPVPETQQAEGQVWDRRVRGLGLGQVSWG